MIREFIVAVFACWPPVQAVQVYPLVPQFPLIPHIKSIKMPPFEQFYQNAIHEQDEKEQKKLDWKYQPLIQAL
jgi:hypothetical protein